MVVVVCVECSSLFTRKTYFCDLQTSYHNTTNTTYTVRIVEPTYNNVEVHHHVKTRIFWNNAEHIFNKKSINGDAYIKPSINICV